MPVRRPPKSRIPRKRRTKPKTNPKKKRPPKAPSTTKSRRRGTGRVTKKYI